MTFDEERQATEQSLLEIPRTTSLRARSRQQDSKQADNAAGDAAHAPVRAREPATQEQRPGEAPLVKSPPLHEEEIPQHDARRPRRASALRWLAYALALVALIPVAAGGYVYWDDAAHFQSTDDAFIAARSFSIAPEAAGYITAVPVTDNQHVEGGTVIARIDDRNYRIALDQAKAQLAHDQAVLKQAQMDLARYQTLLRQNSIAGQQAQDQVYVVQQDQATVALDQANVDNAQLNLDHTVVKADQAGRVVNLTAAVGQYAAAGTALSMFVPDQKWVTANFKETQLDQMRPGQPVTIRIDAYSGRAVHGHVASVQPGSGPAFSLLPPENATGNWVKVVQRVPVKIVMDNPPADVALGPGMSVEAAVRVNPSPALYERLQGRLAAQPGARS